MASHTNCRGMSRRDCIKLGLGALAGAGFTDRVRLRARANEGRSIQPKAKSCILIWQDGGPTHYETFDPKPNAPVEIRGQFGLVGTRIPGVHYSTHMQRLGAIA